MKVYSIVRLSHVYKCVEIFAWSRLSRNIYIFKVYEYYNNNKNIDKIKKDVLIKKKLKIKTLSLIDALYSDENNNFQ